MDGLSKDNIRDLRQPIGAIAGASARTAGFAESSDGRLAAVVSALTTIGGYLDGVETLLAAGSTAAKQDTLGTKLDTLHTDLAALNTLLTTISADLATVKADIATIKGNAANIKANGGGTGLIATVA